jgi:acyl-CoA synthetase (AMP-forming)/AMP-acid ligase II
MTSSMIQEPLREADNPDADLASFTLRRAKQLGHKPALIDGGSGRALSYAELERSARGFAAGLAARGFARGDTFCICLPNMPEVAVAFHGVVAAGGRCTTANPLYTERELGRQLADTDASMLLTAPPFLEAAREAAAPTGCELCVLGEAQGATPFSALLGDPEVAPDVAIDPVTDVAAILYSGGTTGLPKGVLLSHRNLIATLVHAEGALRVTSEDVVIAALPFFHIYGLHVILNMALQAGATVVAMARFDFEQFLDLLERHRVTRGYIVPPIAVALAKDPAVEGRDLSALCHLLSAAAPLSAEVAEACERRLGCPVTQGFGMTEMSGITHLVPPFGEVRKPASIGPAIPGVECRLVDPDTGEDVHPGERGELWMRSPKVMQGYLNNPQATAAMIDQDGWLRSGDIAVVDEDGWFTIVGRIKEIIKYKGFQVFPIELEMILIDHPQVADCAVIGVPDEEAGEVPKAFVVPAGDELDPESLIHLVAEHVAPHKRIRAVEIVEEIPKSPSGRILRRVLEEGQRAANPAIASIGRRDEQA